MGAVMVCSWNFVGLTSLLEVSHVQLDRVTGVPFTMVIVRLQIAPLYRDSTEYPPPNRSLPTTSRQLC